MVYFQKILLLILSFNAIYSLMSFNDNNKPLKVKATFEELDSIMYHSEFKKVWEKVRSDIKNEIINQKLQKEFEDIKPEELKSKENIDNIDIDDEPLLGSANSDSCLLSEEETTEILKNKYEIINNTPREEIRFAILLF